MRPAYSRIAWGLALELFDSRIQYFDILPDALGYLLIMIGLAGVRPRNGKFTAGWIAAAALLVESLPRLAGQSRILNLLQPQTIEFQQLPAMEGAAIVELIMLYGICIGIREQALAEQGQMGLAHSALRVWQMAFGLGAVTLFLLPFLLTADLGALTPLLVMLSLSSFLVGLWVIALVRRAGKRPGPGQATDVNGGGQTTEGEPNRRERVGE